MVIWCSWLNFSFLGQTDRISQRHGLGSVFFTGRTSECTTRTSYYWWNKSEYFCCVFRVPFKSSCCPLRLKREVPEDPSVVWVLGIECIMLNTCLSELHLHMENPLMAYQRKFNTEECKQQCRQKGWNFIIPTVLRCFRWWIPGRQRPLDSLGMIL